MVTTHDPLVGEAALRSRAYIPAVLAALGCVLASGACTEQAAREAEARAKAWGIPAARITRAVVYAEYGQRQLRLDVYRPPVQQGVAPGIVAVRGGAWQQGDKEFFSYIAGQLAMEGFVTASIEYRTSGEAKFPAAVHDVKAAVRWMRAHAAEYGVDPHAIGAIGGSAGAHLVAMLATSTPGTLEGEGGNAATSSEVQAVVAMGGAYNLESRDGVGSEFIRAVTEFIGAPLGAHAEALAAASPVRHVSSRSAPLLLLHSPTDPLAPFGQAVAMEQAYRRAGAPVALKAIDAPGSHGFWGDPRYFPEARRQAVEFFRKHLKVAE
jgi:acetyl esterase/lipase